MGLGKNKYILAMLGMLMTAAYQAESIELIPLDISPLVFNGQSDPKPSPTKESKQNKKKVDGKSVDRSRTRVSILGYHDFSRTRPATQMCLNTDEFRRHLEYIRTEGLTVISMQEFLDWLHGKLELPAQCVLITIDDGWRSVYTDAYPILKEYGFPFTIFLYTDFISGKGDSMSTAMIRDMQQNGATVGSHSATHAYPSEWKEALKRGADKMEGMLNKELKDSKKILDNRFGTVNTYCYPGGFVMQEMLDQMNAFGYSAAFTVLPGKVNIQEDPLQIHRYIVFGNDNNRVFDLAMDFRMADSSTAVSAGYIPGTIPPTTPVPPFIVFPAPKSSVADDSIEIKAQFGSMPHIDLDTVQMRVSGYGLVPAQIDNLSRTMSWAPPSRVHLNNLSVHLTWKTSDSKSHKTQWSFQVKPSEAQ